MRINLTEKERAIISNKTSVSQSYRRNVHMHTRKKANKMIENLEFLANHLPESQQKQIFTPEKISSLFKTLLKYRIVPKSGGEPISRLRGQKYTYPTEKDAQTIHTKYVGIPHSKEKQTKRLPHNVYEFFKKSTPPDQWDTQKKFIGWGGPFMPHPSFRRQTKISTIILEQIYNNTIDKIFTEETAKAIKIHSKLVLKYNLSTNNLSYHPKKVWIQQIIEESIFTPWSKEVVKNWIDTLQNRLEKQNLPTTDQLLDLIQIWLLQFLKQKSTIDKTQIIALEKPE